MDEWKDFEEPAKEIIATNNEKKNNIRSESFIYSEVRHKINK